MSSKLEIINFALDRLAVAPLSDLTTVSEVLDLCNRTYEQARVFRKMCSVVSPTVNATPSKVPSSVTEVLNKL
jgi:hypothetical protein